MKTTNHLVLLSAIAVLSPVCMGIAAEPAAERTDIIEHSRDGETTPIEARIHRRLEWLKDQKFGALVCWGPSVEWGGVQSWFLCPEKGVESWARPDSFEPWIRHKKDIKAMSGAYFEVYKQFDPRAFDADELVNALSEAGVRYAGLTTKHHDGFCLFDTRTTDFKITSRQCPYATHPKADVAAAFYESLGKARLGTLCYFSKSDWHTPYYWSPRFPVVDRNANYDTAKHPELWNEFKGFTYRQIEELMSRYGKMDILWLDGGQVRPPNMDIDMDRIASMARSHQPDLLIVDRTVGGKHENYITPEQHIPAHPINATWEACMTIQKEGWIWRKNATYWPAQELVHRLVRIVSDGGNYLIGLGPDADGRLTPEVEARLEAIGEWLAVNGEGIYGTRAGDFQKNRANRHIVYTLSKDKRHAYMHLLAWPERRLAVQSPVAVEAASNIMMLGRETPLKWELEDGRLVVHFEGVEKPCRHAWVLKIKLNRE